MKKIIVLIAGVMIATTGCAHEAYHHRAHPSNGWVAPVIVGAAIGYAIASPAPTVIYTSPQPMYTPPPPMPVPPPTVVSPDRANFWYYCARYQAYFPYVATCPDPWTMVMPR